VDDPYLERRLQKLEEGVEEYLRDQRLILSELKRVSKGLDEVKEKLSAIDKRLAMQEVKSGLLGGVGGAIVMALKWVLTGNLR